MVERASGDLSVTDEYGTQRLGLTDLRLGIAANDGVWSLTAALAGETVGVASGAVTARTSPTRRLARRRARRSKACSKCASPNSAPGDDGCRRAGA